jgi:hypothetical protein
MTLLLTLLVGVFLVIASELGSNGVGSGTVEAFNVDVSSATVYSGKPGSYFGFSVDLHQSGGGKFSHHRQQPIVNW